MAALALLAACEGMPDLPNPFGGGDAAGDGPVQRADGSVELVERDVEAPEIFQVTEEGLWDGRPSLGGVWVAHPDVTDPERVIIRNPSNGNFVIGALFRRERENPGPSLQVSSDAAAALGMLAGAPATLNVTALRREEQAAPQPTEATDPEGAGAIAAPEGVTTSSLAPDGVTTSSLEPTESAAPGPAQQAPTPMSAPEPLPTPTPAPAQAASSLDRPYIQLGIFSIEANAEGTRAQMESRGLSARVLEESSQGRTYWRVIVGPAASEAERTRLLDAVKAAGFADAYAVRG